MISAVPPFVLSKDEHRVFQWNLFYRLIPCFSRLTAYLITLSVLAKMFGEIIRPICLAVLIDKLWFQAAQKDLRGEAREDR